MIVVLDTNVWISALQFASRNGVPTRVLHRALTQDTIATCDEIEDEIRRVLVTKFHWETQRALDTISSLTTQAVRVRLSNTVQGCRDLDDDKFLECSRLSGASVLVAGDKDLLVLGTFHRTRIVTPAAYLRLKSEVS